MIYILVGTDYKKRSTYLNDLAKDIDVIRLPESEISKEIIMNYAGGVSLFGGASQVVIEGLIRSGEINFTDDEFKRLKDSINTFVLLEDKLLVTTEKKYKKFAEIIRFEEKKIVQTPKINTFAIADAYGAHDKIKAWILYREAIESGVEPEPISGILFWKIKTMILNGTKTFSMDALKKQSSELTSLYHKSHRGESDFVVGLEQFILSSLSK